MLVVQAGDIEPRITHLTGPELVIGRHPTCGLRVDDAAVSHRHCRVLRQGNRVSVEDLSSTNGTQINGHKVRLAELHPGDQLQVGPARFRLEIVGEGAPKSTGPADWAEEILDERNRPQFKARLLDSTPESPVAASARAILDRMKGQRLDDGDDEDEEAEVEEDSEPSDPDADRPASAVPLVDFPGEGRVYLRIGQARGVVVIQVVAGTLVDEDEIEDLGRRLDDVLKAGHTRIVLELGRVRYVASQAVGVLARAHKKCQAGGGRLKLACLRPELAEILSVMGLKKLFEIQPDERTAMEGAWPNSSASQPELSATLRRLQKVAGVPRPPSPARTSESKPPSHTPVGPMPAAPAPPQHAAPVRPAAAADPSPVRLGLTVLVGKAKGKTIEIKIPRFVIGRDPRCQLRPDSEAIGRLHAVLERREGRVFVRDLGTTNGTVVNDRTLRGEEVEVANGDRLQIGPLQFALLIEPRVRDPRELEDEVARMLLGEGRADADAPTQLHSTISRPPGDPTSG